MSSKRRCVGGELHVSVVAVAACTTVDDNEDRVMLLNIAQHVPARTNLRIMVVDRKGLLVALEWNAALVVVLNDEARTNAMVILHMVANVQLETRYLSQ